MQEAPKKETVITIMIIIKYNEEELAPPAVVLE
jgi:hypothetical protein